MKFFFLIFSFALLLTGQSRAQVKSFTQSAPISIAGDGMAGKKEDDEATMKAREELARSQVKKEKAQNSRFVTQELPRFMEFSFGPVLSSWSQLSSELEDDSWATGLAWGQFFQPQLSASLGIEFIHPQEQQFVAEEVRVFQLSGTLKHHHAVSKNFSLVSGGSVLMADWNVRKKLSTTNSKDIYQTYDSGSGIALRPEASLRWHLSDSSGLDLKSSWTQFFGDPQNEFGGFGLSLQLHVQH